MEKQALELILESHKKWLSDDGGSRADLSGANLSRADLSGANLSGANLSWADLSGANLSRANLSGADLSGANLSRANLSRADLSGADLSGADLSGADLSGADLSRADLSRADLSRAENLDDARLNNCAGDRSRIMSIFVSDKWPITYTKNVLQIGCQKHKHEEWKNFTDDQIAEMDSDALEFWCEMKDYIFMTIDRFPAK